MRRADLGSVVNAIAVIVVAAIAAEQSALRRVCDAPYSGYGGGGSARCAARSAADQLSRRPPK